MITRRITIINLTPAQAADIRAGHHIPEIAVQPPVQVFTPPTLPPTHTFLGRVHDMLMPILHSAGAHWEMLLVLGLLTGIAGYLIYWMSTHQQPTVTQLKIGHVPKNSFVRQSVPIKQLSEPFISKRVNGSGRTIDFDTLLLNLQDPYTREGAIKNYAIARVSGLLTPEQNQIFSAKLLADRKAEVGRNGNANHASAAFLGSA